MDWRRSRKLSSVSRSTAAARELGTSTSAISKTVARLEQQLGTRLLARSTRHVGPTEAGKLFYERSIRVLQEVENAELELDAYSGEARGLLKLSAPVVFGELHVAPLVAELLLQRPDLRVVLSLSDRFVDLIEEGYDAAVRVGSASGGSISVRTVARVPVVLCASPKYLARRGEPLIPGDLVHHDCLRYTLGPSPSRWSFRGEHGEVITVPVNGRFESNHGGALREAALAGLGVVRFPSFYVHRELKERLLLPLLPSFAPDEIKVHGLYPAARPVPPKVRVLIDWLAQHLPARVKRAAAL